MSTVEYKKVIYLKNLTIEPNKNEHLGLPINKAISQLMINKIGGEDNREKKSDAKFEKKKNQFIDVKNNGRLFPSWVLANFKKYKLPEYEYLLTGEDPCKVELKAVFQKHQVFLEKFFNYNSPYRDILIFHGLGSGKTASTINIYNSLYNANPGWNVFILIKAALKTSTWMVELKRWLQKEETEYRMRNIIFISYDAPNADKAFINAVRSSDSSKKSLYIIDEAHNFIKNVYTNISTKQGRRAQVIYDHIIQEKKDNIDNVRIILISATPAINKPFELALLFNLLRVDLFPKSETKFNQIYVTEGSLAKLNPNRKNNFQRRIIGLVSYYSGYLPGLFASAKLQFVDLPMSKYHDEIYTYYENIEAKMAQNRGFRSTNTIDAQKLKSYTRQACDFVFPRISQTVSGETRPRPRQFNIKTKDTAVHLNSTEDDDDNKEAVKLYVQEINRFVNEFDAYLLKNKLIDDKSGHTLSDDIDKIIKNFNGDFKAYMSSNEKKSNLLKVMYDTSCKYPAMIINILQSKGPTLIYSNYVVMEGFQILEVFLKYFGFTEYGKTEGKEYFNYTSYHGGIDPREREERRLAYNKPENIRGALCKIIFISPAGTEGLSLMNVMQVHITEPFWHEVRIEQMIGRAIRFRSHCALPIEERVVEVFRYKAVHANKDLKETTDQYIENQARNKKGLIESFLDALKEVAVDCEINKNYNKISNDSKCFQFEEKSLFNNPVGPAYKEDIYEDLNYDNGSNSVNAIVKRIKVIKIKAVIRLNDPETNPNDSPEYSKEDNYWYNPDSNVIYDYETKYPVGRIGVDDNNLPLKLNSDTFIITYVIPMPMLANY